MTNKIIDQATIPKETDDSMIERLRNLTPLEYDRERAKAAGKLGVRASTLDGMVKKQKVDQNDLADFPEVEPWSEEINPGDLLTELSQTIKRFIVCDAEVADAAALWAAFTWVIDAAQVAPLAIISAPEKRCGKSQLLTILGRLSRKPITASNITPSALFRSIEAWQPTLLIDETDACMKDNEELRGIINSGHTRDSAYVVRVTGDDHIPKRFSTWGAKALSGIGQLSDTLMDRGIVLELRRKLPNENVERLRRAEPELFATLTRKLARFAIDFSYTLSISRPQLPESLNDRAQDNWEALLAIADLAGGDWPNLARNAAIKLSGEDEATSKTMTVGIELLMDIKSIFEDKNIDRIRSKDLVDSLCDDDERPWATYNRGRPIAARQVSQKLKGYGIKVNQTINLGGRTAKGYLKDYFTEAWIRYLPSDTSNLSVTIGNSVTSLYPCGSPSYRYDQVTDSIGNFGEKTGDITDSVTTVTV